MRRQVISILAIGALATGGAPALADAPVAGAKMFNNNPVAVDDTHTMDWCTSTEIDLLSNDSDPDNDDLTIISVDQPSSGNATISGSGVTFVSDRPGVYPIDYTISDGNGGTDVGTLTVTVNRTHAPDPCG